jgi:hypothetical protein
VLADVVVEALEAAVLVLAAVEAEAGVDVVLVLVPEAAEGTLTVLTGARVLLAAVVLAELAGAVVLALVLPVPELLWPLLSKPTRVCSRLANSAARPPPMPALLLEPLEAFELELVPVLAAV